MSEHNRSHDAIVQIKVKLLEVSKPPVWRRLQLRADTRLDHLHELLVAAFGWQHEIVVEDLLDPDPETRYPVLVAAKGGCPPEDCGGPWGYAELKEILADPGHEQRQEMLDWLGLDNATQFDPTAVAIGHVEEELALGK